MERDHAGDGLDAADSNGAARRHGPGGGLAIWILAASAAVDPAAATVIVASAATSVGQDTEEQDSAPHPAQSSLGWKDGQEVS